MMKTAEPSIPTTPLFLFTAALVSSLVVASSPASAGIIKVGRGSYTTDIPKGAKVPSDTEGKPVSPCVTENVTRPLPTNDWWSSLAWKRTSGNRYSQNMYAHPLAFRAKAAGLGVSYPTVVTTTPDGRNYNCHYSEDFTAGLVGLSAPETRVDDFSAWTVTASWSDGRRRLRATFGHGLPFVYFERAGVQPRPDALVMFKRRPRLWHNEGPVAAATVNGHHYGLFALKDTTWRSREDGRVLRNGGDCFSIALLPDDEVDTLELFRKRAFAFVVDTCVNWRYDESKAELVTDFKLKTQAREGAGRTPLIALYRHQWLHTSAKLTGKSYTSARGEMKLLEASAFSTRMTFNGLLPALPIAEGVDRAKLRKYVNDACRGDGHIRSADTYWTGKLLGRAASLVHVAHQAGCAAARDRMLAAIKRELEDWFTASDGETTKLFYYNQTWGTLIGVPASYGSDDQLNDHGFHYGYFVMAAAAVARFDPDWADDDNWGGMVKLLINDVANPNRDGERFGWLRGFDPYAGHSWASGHAAFAAGNNQESSSEAINFGNALTLWAAATGDKELLTLGIYLYLTEVNAVEQYWFDVDGEVFPEGFEQTALGILWSNGGAYATWWTANPEEIHGINFLPITGGSLYLGRRPDYVRRNYHDLVKTNGGPPAQWRDIILCYRALADPESAAADLAANPDYEPTSGMSRANTFAWIENLKAMGRLDTGVIADAPTAVVFSKQGRRTYVAWNPGAEPVVVSFSDGKAMEVPPGRIISRR